MIKKQVPRSFVSVDVSRKTRKSKFFHQVNSVIDWTVFEKGLSGAGKPFTQKSHSGT
jgi:hypothetical protein